MADNLTISKQDPTFPEYLDFQVLRKIGIDHIQTLSRQIWTDYNLHDPGVTILEILCYALTDLGYRNNLDIEDLLALKPGDGNQPENNFFTPDAILTCNPTTPLDWRRRLIDIADVRNAWLTQVDSSQPAIYVNCTDSQLQYDVPPHQSPAQTVRLNPRGLYDVCLDLEPAYHQAIDGGAAEATVLTAVKAVLCSYRNLGEDFRDVFILGQEEIGLCTDIELTPDADPEDVLVDIYLRVQTFLVPQLRFYTLQELLTKGKNPAEIFAGRPSVLHDAAFADESHGFIDPEELAALQLPEALYSSDIYQIIMDVPGVAAIKKLSLINYIDGLPQSQGHPWYLQLTAKHRPVLSVAQSQVTFFKGDLPFKADEDEVARRYREQQAAYIKAPLDPYYLDLSVPRGSYHDLADHYSIHHDFPLTYGIGEDGLPTSGVTAKRQAQAKQLKGYLVFFDQVLANYLAQLAHVRDLFSWESEADRQDRQRTYFTQVLTNIPGVEEIIRHGSIASDGDSMDYGSLLAAISEDLFIYQARRNRFLDHLLARFAEQFTNYVALNYRLRGGRRDKADIIDDKARYLREYPRLSRDRARAFNYCQPDQVWDTENVAGFQRRVARLLGIEDISRRTLSAYAITHNGTEFTLTLGNNNGNNLQLTGTGPYPSRESAQMALMAILSAVSQPANLRPLVYRSPDSYGFGIFDDTDKLLATSAIYAAQADAAAAIATLQTDNLPWIIQPQPPAYTGRLNDRDGQPLLQGTRRHSYTWATLGDSGDNGSVVARWQSDDEAWQTLRDNLGIALSAEQPDDQLAVQVIPAGETPR
ncbi:MAG: hypothetical protein F6K31_33320, partial [Symploca sp. SIO2G7]|nr:hypothetical protein [Symploca sp. SIO2G7]